jgi:aspartate oxidase
MAQGRMEQVRKEINDMIKMYQEAANILELLDIKNISSLMIEASLNRGRSRGLHYMEN